MNISVDSLRSNSIIMENLSEMMVAQEGRDRIGYENVVLEALAAPTGQAVLLDKLFKETEKLDGIDFGRIPDTRGDITKYQYYGQLNDCIELINSICIDKSTPNIDSMNKLHRILLDARPDFEFGFKANNYVIINLYKVMYLTLFELENVCIVDMTNHLREKLSIDLNAKTSSQIRSITNTANQFIKMYENGQWNTMVRGFKAGKALEFASNHEDGQDPVMENIAISGKLDFSFDQGKKLIDNIKSAPDKFAKVWAGIKSWAGDNKAGTIIIAVIGVLLLIRGAIYLFLNGAGNLKRILKTNADILKANIEKGGSDQSIERQKWLLDRFENTADVIEYNLLKAEKAADKEIAKSDRENYGPSEFRSESGDFQF